jgi:hypothetical protein
MRFLILALVAVLVAGCMHPPTETTPLFCAKQHEETSMGGKIVVCDELFPQAPHVHLPDAAKGRVFAAIENGTFRTADGKTYPVSEPDDEARNSALTIYELTLDGAAVKSHRPAVRLSESFFLAPLLGMTLEGNLSARMGADEYELNTTLPIRVQIAATFAAEPEEGRTHQVVATIVNFNQTVQASDGRCLPALTSHGSLSTFDATDQVELRGHRHPSMHAFGDDQFVFGWLVNGATYGSMMDGPWYRGPVDLVRGTHHVTGPYSGYGHGAPYSLPTIDVTPVTGGGQACTTAS